MNCTETAVDIREMTQKELELAGKQTELLFKLNHTLPRSEAYFKILKELFSDNIGEGSYIAPPLSGAAIERLKIGRNVFINSNLLAMSRGGITIEDDVQIAGNVSLLSNNHDLYDRQILLCKPIRIQKGAWIGAGVSILAGVSVGKYAVVGAGSVVTKDIPDYCVAVGNPAKVIKHLDENRFD